MLFVLLVLATFFLAYSNGANDNFKGVATLFGCGATNYRRAIVWATLTTLAGSMCAVFMAGELVKNFSGKGLVPDNIAASAEFLFAVGLGAALTVLLATIVGFPISTTHALTGGLVGAGLVAVGSAVNFSKLGTTFFAPLLISPAVALVSGATFYALLHALRVAIGITEMDCVCVDPPTVAYATQMNGAILAQTAALEVTKAPTATCAREYKGSVIGISVQSALDTMHFLSAGAVSFARGLNDTPKIVALLLIVKAIGLEVGMIAVAFGMALGGLFNAKKVALMMSKKITTMNHGQGFTANLVTAVLVLFASRWGVPVSTTHVSVGAITGMGLVTGKASARVVGQIVLSWVLTLPIAAALSALLYLAAHSLSN